MKKVIIFVLIIILFTGICPAAVYKIKNSSSGPVVINGSSTTTTTNYYNNYNPSSYVGNNAVNSSPAEIIEIVMDFSGSMHDVIESAKATAKDIVLQIPSTTQLGLRVFGELDSFSYQTGCQATAVVTPIATANANALISGIESIKKHGTNTPLVFGLENAAYKDLDKFPRDKKKKIVLVTDGGENCGGDPCAFAKKLMSQRRDIQIDVVYISRYKTEPFVCLTTITGGNYYHIKDKYDSTQFLKSVTDSINNIPPDRTTQPTDNKNKTTPVNTENKKPEEQNTNEQGYQYYNDD